MVHLNGNFCFIFPFKSTPDFLFPVLYKNISAGHVEELSKAAFSHHLLELKPFHWGLLLLKYKLLLVFIHLRYNAGIIIFYTKIVFN